MKKLLIPCFLLAYSVIYSQNRLNIPALPFLTIPTDARHSGMGNAAGATSPNVSAIFYNPAKLLG
jgi:hypothetical protein